MITVPYVPTLGPVHPGALSAGLFEEVFATGEKPLPHDHQRRWAARKDEWVIEDRVVHTATLTVIPTWSTRTRTVTAYCYGTDLDHAQHMAAELCLDYATPQGRLVSFLSMPVHAGAGRTARVLVQDLTSFPPLPDRIVRRLDTERDRSEFAVFAHAMRQHGFGFLHERSYAVGPILITRAGGRIVGAIGPMETLPDAAGCRRLVPQYWGVLPEFRGRGYGRELWRAAMAWGHAHGAAYQLLQADSGSVSELLCLDEGLATLGLVHKEPVFATRRHPVTVNDKQ